jgi:hypothetical protein
MIRRNDSSHISESIFDEEMVVIFPVGSRRGTQNSMNDDLKSREDMKDSQWCRDETMARLFSGHAD